MIYQVLQLYWPRSVIGESFLFHHSPSDFDFMFGVLPDLVINYVSIFFWHMRGRAQVWTGTMRGSVLVT